jgi:hypothetical protein
MTASQQPPPDHAANAGVSVEDLFRGIEPIRSADDLARDGIFEDGELEQFLTNLRAMRHADTA